MLTEDELYAKIGRLQIAYEQEKARFDQLLEHVALIITGEIERSRVMVNLDGREFQVVQRGCVPGTPATINGRPRCVVGVVEKPTIVVEEEAA